MTLSPENLIIDDARHLECTAVLCCPVSNCCCL